MFQIQCVDFPFELKAEILYTITETIGQLVDIHQGIISTMIIDDVRMQELNKMYRKIDATTDVLSFHYFDDFVECSPDEIVGEIVFSESRLKNQAVEFWHSIEEECYRLMVHGIIHILGFDHETDEEYAEMWEIEKQVLEAVAKKHQILIREIE